MPYLTSERSQERMETLTVLYDLGQMMQIDHAMALTV